MRPMRKTVAKCIEWQFVVVNFLTERSFIATNQQPTLFTSRGFPTLGHWKWLFERKSWEFARGRRLRSCSIHSNSSQDFEGFHFSSSLRSPSEGKYFVLTYFSCWRWLCNSRCSNVTSWDEFVGNLSVPTEDEIKMNFISLVGRCWSVDGWTFWWTLTLLNLWTYWTCEPIDLLNFKNLQKLKLILFWLS